MAPYGGHGTSHTAAGEDESAEDEDQGPSESDAGLQNNRTGMGKVIGKEEDDEIGPLRRCAEQPGVAAISGAIGHRDSYIHAAIIAPGFMADRRKE